MAQKQNQNQGDIIRSFTLGNKELEGKTAEFLYDRGQYSITDVVGEERSIVYKSRNAQEAYTKWNVYIGRKKERPERPERVAEAPSNEEKQSKNKEKRKSNERQSDNSERRKNEGNDYRQNENNNTGGYNQGFTAVNNSENRQEKNRRRNHHHRNHRREQES